MTSATAQVEYQKIQKQELEYQNYAKQKNDEMNEKLMVTQNQINDAINTFIQKYNQEKQYAMILISQGDVEGDGVVTLGTPVLTADPALDITDDVLAGLNEEYVAAKSSK
jgi:outer membrane protein